MRNVAESVMWRPMRKCPDLLRGFRTGRHISSTSKRLKKGHDLRLMPSPITASISIDFTFGERLSLCLQINLSVDVCGVHRNVTEPPTNRVDVHTGPKQVTGC